MENGRDLLLLELFDLVVVVVSLSSSTGTALCLGCLDGRRVLWIRSRIRSSCLLWLNEVGLFASIFRRCLALLLVVVVYLEVVPMKHSYEFRLTSSTNQMIG